MQLTLRSIRKVPRSKSSFVIGFSVGKTDHRATVTINRFGGMEFTDPAMAGVLLHTGRRARHLASAICAYARGEKLQLPLTFPDDRPANGLLVLTVKPSRKPLSIVGTD